MEKDSLTLDIAADKSVATISAYGAVTIEHAVRLRDLLTTALTEARQTVLDLNQIAELDVTAVQILCSACKTAAEKKVMFRIEGKQPECMKGLEQTLGIQSAFPCRQNNNEPCPLTGGVS